MTEALIALVALTLMEIVLGIDNIIFIAIVTDRLPEEQQPSARRLGLIAALVMRILLLLSITLIMKLTDPVFTLTGLGLPESWLSGDPDAIRQINEVSWRDIILLVGGLFLIGKSADEIHDRFEGDEEAFDVSKRTTFARVMLQIAMLDIIFSLDSVITAVGMVEPDKLWVMVTAVVLAVGVMLTFADGISLFVKKHPSLKMLALSFLIMIGVMLVAEAAGTHINKGYVYFAMAFALGVEALNLMSGSRGKPAVEAATQSETT